MGQGPATFILCYYTSQLLILFYFYSHIYVCMYAYMYARRYARIGMCVRIYLYLSNFYLKDKNLPFELER